MSADNDRVAMNEFLRQVEHDLRNPLGTVIMSAQALLRTTLTPEQERITRVVLRASEKALHVVAEHLQMQMDKNANR
jgi:signal transduction histidine kinase